MPNYRSYMIWRRILFVGIAILAIVLGSLLVSCNLIHDPKELDVYQTLMDSARDAVDRNAFRSAEKDYLAALDIASKRNWVDGIVMSKHALAKLYMAEKNYDKAETVIKDTKEYCRASADCSPTFLRAVYYTYVFFCIHNRKDISKAKDLIEEMIGQKSRLFLDESIENPLDDFALYMEGVGFQAEACELRERIKMLK